MNSFVKKLLYIILFAGIYFLLERFALINTAFDNVQFCYAQPVANCVSVILGPFVGSFAAAIGEFFVTHFQNTPNDWIAVACAFLSTGAVGLSMKDVDIKNGFFQRSDVLRFNAAHTLATFVCWVILYPRLSALLMHKEVHQAFIHGVGQAIGMWVTNFVVGTLLLTLYAKSRISAANFYRS